MLDRATASGVPGLGEISWRSHIRPFDDDRDDLADTLVPCFIAGLRAHDACPWMTPEPPGAADARSALAAAVPDRRERGRQLENVDSRDGSLRTGSTDAATTLQMWLDRERAALQAGHRELRLGGNTFWLERADSGPLRAARVGVPGRPRVLVVDDNEDAALLLAEALQLSGYDTAIANDGPTALELAARELPAAAILDIGLPVMDGYQLAARLRQLPGLADLKLIALTGHGTREDHARSAAAGFDRHVVKPIELMTLVAHLQVLLPG